VQRSTRNWLGPRSCSGEASIHPGSSLQIRNIEQRILAALEEDATATYEEIAERADVSEPSISKYIQKLEEEGVIAGYSADLNPGLC
jgi:DNA-binding Lrp family transcriptional regulator